MNVQIDKNTLISLKGIESKMNAWNDLGKQLEVGKLNHANSTFLTKKKKAYFCADIRFHRLFEFIGVVKNLLLV